MRSDARKTRKDLRVLDQSQVSSSEQSKNHKRVRACSSGTFHPTCLCCSSSLTGPPFLTSITTCSNLTCSIKVHHISLFKEAFLILLNRCGASIILSNQTFFCAVIMAHFDNLLEIYFSLNIQWVRTVVTGFASTQLLPATSHTLAAQQAFSSITT